MPTTLTKADLANLINFRLGLNVRESKDFVASFFEEICATLEKGGNVKLSGFGNFQLRDKPVRPGRNPKTNEAVTISARRVVTFQPSIMLREKINKAATGD